MLAHMSPGQRLDCTHIGSVNVARLRPFKPATWWYCVFVYRVSPWCPPQVACISRSCHKHPYSAARIGSVALLPGLHPFPSGLLLWMQTCLLHLYM